MRRNDHVRLAEEWSEGPHHERFDGVLVHWVTGVGNDENFLIACDPTMVYDPDVTIVDDVLTCLRCIRRWRWR